MKKRSVKIRKTELRDEREVIAEEFFKFIKRCRKQGVDDEFASYITLNLVSSFFYTDDPEMFHSMIEDFVAGKMAEEERQTMI